MVSLYDIQVFTPRTLEEALELLDKMGGRTKIIAGGTDLIIQMRHGLAPRRDLINIYGLRELRYIREEHGMVRIGALTTFSEVAASEPIQKHVPFLAEAANTIGSIQIMNKATIGGNLVNASPAADSLPPLYVLDASVKIVGRKGERTVSIERFYKGYKKMDIAPDEILAEISFKIPDADGRGLFFKHGLRLGDAISVVNGPVSWARRCV